MSNMTLQKTYENAIQYINEGKLADAETLLKQFLTLQDSDLNCERLLGIVYLRQKKFDDAIKTFKAITTKVKGTPLAIKDLIDAYKAANQTKDALAFLEKEAKNTAESIPAWLVMGDLLVELDRIPEARAAYQKVETLDPMKQENDLAQEGLNQNNPAFAAQKYQEILSKDPSNIRAQTGLAIFAMESGNYNQAKSIFSTVEKTARYWPLALIASSDLLMRTGYLSEAENYLRLAVKISPDNITSWGLLGVVCDFLAKFDDAVDAFNMALKIQPNQPNVLLSLGHLYRVTGDTKKCIHFYKKHIEQTPFNGGAYWGLANLKTYKFSKNEIADIIKASKRENFPPDQLAQMNFSLGKAFEQLKDYDKAFDYYKHGNLIQRSITQYDSQAIAKDIEDVITGYSRSMLEKLANYDQSSNAPIFILGLPRTGSTLLEQILASHSEVDATMELPFISTFILELTQQGDKFGGYPINAKNLAPQNFKILAERYLKSVAPYRKGAARFIDKMPNNFRHIGLIYLMFPDAKIIDMRRHPMDTCLSLYKQHFAMGQPYSYNLGELGHYYQQYLKQMNHWNAVLPNKIYTIYYENLVQNPEDEISRVLQYCGLTFEEACLTPHKTKRVIRTASSEQVKQPITQDNLHYWGNFEKHLEELKVALGDSNHQY